MRLRNSRAGGRCPPLISAHQLFFHRRIFDVITLSLLKRARRVKNVRMRNDLAKREGVRHADDMLYVIIVPINLVKNRQGIADFIMSLRFGLRDVDMDEVFFALIIGWIEFIIDLKGRCAVSERQSMVVCDDIGARIILNAIDGRDAFAAFYNEVFNFFAFVGDWIAEVIQEIVRVAKGFHHPAFVCISDVAKQENTADNEEDDENEGESTSEYRA